jgi:hypothetical protein
MSSVSDVISIKAISDIASVTVDSSESFGISSILDTILTFINNHKVIIIALIIVCIVTYFVFTLYMRSTSEVTILKNNLKESQNNLEKVRKLDLDESSSVQVPNGLVQEPNGLVQVPNGLVQVPNGLVQVPNGLVQVPNDIEQVPYVVQDIRDEMVKDFPVSQMHHVDHENEATIERPDLDSRLQSFGLNLNDLRDELSHDQYQHDHPDHPDQQEVGNPDLSEFISNNNFSIEPTNRENKDGLVELDHPEPVDSVSGYMEYNDEDNDEDTEDDVEYNNEDNVEDNVESEELHNRCLHVNKRGPNVGSRCDTSSYLRNTADGLYCGKHMRGKTQI